MTDLRNQRRLAGQVLAIGETRVWIDPLHADDVATAVTREDVRGLIAKGYIAKLQAKGVSRGRARKTALQKSKGKQKGPGSREGSQGAMARDPRKQRWLRTIRPLRQTLQMLRDDEVLASDAYRRYYLRSKGGVFRSRQHLLSHLVTEGLLTDAQARDYRLKAEQARAALFNRRPGSEGNQPAPARRPGRPPKGGEAPKAKRAAKPAKAEPAEAPGPAAEDTEGGEA
jgi:large subunit ribosomal protein L19e